MFITRKSDNPPDAFFFLSSLIISFLLIHLVGRPMALVYIIVVPKDIKLPDTEQEVAEINWSIN